jgi:hypothetical protein
MKHLLTVCTGIFYSFFSCTGRELFWKNAKEVPLQKISSLRGEKGNLYFPLQVKIMDALDIRPFLYSISGRIPDLSARYLILKIVGYPTGWQSPYFFVTLVLEMHIAQSTEFLFQSHTRGGHQ